MKPGAPGASAPLHFGSSMLRSSTNSADQRGRKVLTAGAMLSNKRETMSLWQQRFWPQTSLSVTAALTLV